MPTKPPVLPVQYPPGPPDPRVNAWRGDMAAVSLRGVVEAPHFVEGNSQQIVWPLAPLRRNPVAAGRLETELLFGETVTVYDEAEGWCWVQAALDRYVGYVPSGALHAKSGAASHSVSALGTFVYPVPDIKSPPLMHLSLGSQLKIEDRDDRFSRLASGGYVINRPNSSASFASLVARSVPVACRQSFGWPSFRLSAANSFSSRSPNALSAHPTCGVDARGSDSIARGCCKSAYRLLVSWRPATATCRRSSSACASKPRTDSTVSSAAT